MTANGVIGEIGDPPFPLPGDTALHMRIKVRKSARKEVRAVSLKNGKWGITDFTDVTDRSKTLGVFSQGKLMNTKEMRVVRRVTGRRGSLSLYRLRHGFAEVLKVADGDTDVIEVHRHELNALRPLLNYMDEVQGEIDALNETASRSKQGAARGSSSY
jgi:hypothetical protein